MEQVLQGSLVRILEEVKQKEEKERNEFPICFLLFTYNSQQQQEDEEEHRLCSTGQNVPTPAIIAIIMEQRNLSMHHQRNHQEKL